MNRFWLLFYLFICAPAYAVEPSESVPDFTLKSMRGDNLRLEELRGQVVLINFWASWCGPCRQEMPLLQQIHQRYAPMGFTVLGVNVDESPEKAQRIVDRMTIDFPLLLDTNQAVSESYQVDAMPFTVLVDRDGVVRYVHRGYKSGDEAQYVDKLRPLLRRVTSTGQPSATAQGAGS